GTVHLARMRGMGGFERDVALKLAHEYLDAELATTDLFEEARIAARLRHPNVVPVLDVGEDDGKPWIVMEYVEGDSLSGLAKAAPRVTGEPMPTGILLRAIADALSGLHAAHELTAEDGTTLTLVHRDFSPQNVLVGLDGLARLTDFGVAKLLARSDSTRSGIVKGKVRYMSPEQARGEKLDRRCDVWAAGVVLWEMLARKRLFTGDADAAILLKIVTERAPLLRTVDPSIHPSLEAAVAGALEPDLEKRTASARTLRHALVKATREAGLEVEQEDVATFVTKIVGDAVAERRSKAASIARATSARAKPQPIVDETEIMLGAPVAPPPSDDVMKTRPLPPPVPPPMRTPRVRPPPPPRPDPDAHGPESETTSGASSLVASGARPALRSPEPPPRIKEQIERTLQSGLAFVRKQPPLYVGLGGACAALLFVGFVLIVASVAKGKRDGVAAADSSSAPRAPLAASAASAGAAAGGEIAARANAIAPPPPVPPVADPAASVAPAEHMHVVELRSTNGDIREVRYAGKVITVAPPRGVVVLQLPDSDLFVEAVATDGRHAGGTLAGDAASMSLTFWATPKKP
ncbi:MAG TPA: serine/threonine-protein kinase, partial [Labilithrix sp.]